MKTGDYITERYLPRFVEAAATDHGIACVSMSDEWVIRLEKTGVVRWVVGYQFDINSTAASALASDKVATHLTLRSANVPSLQHLLVRTQPNQPIDTSALQNRFGSAPFVIKPLDGTGGRGVRLVRSVAEAADAIARSGEVAWAASPYYDIASEYRLIMLDGALLLAYEKTQPHEIHGLRFYNLGLGAQATNITDPELQTRLFAVANSAMQAMSLRAAAVDIIQTNADELIVLEINDGIMMENYARQSEIYKKRAAQVYDALTLAMFMR